MIAGKLITMGKHALNVQTGDRITFKSPCRWGSHTVTRTITGFDHLGRVLVTYGGYKDFMVHDHEIKSIPDVGKNAK